MHSMTAFAGTLTIPSGQTDSNVLLIEQGKLAISLSVANPAAFTGTVTLYAALDDASTPLSIGTTLTANQVQSIALAGAKQLQIKSGSSEGADRAVKVYIVVILAGGRDE